MKIMKYIYSIIIFLVFLLILTSLIEFNYTKEVINFDMDGNDITNIIVDLDNANVTLSSSLDKDIKIEHVYSPEKTPSTNLYTYQDGEDLIVREYAYNKSNLVSKKETLNIYIPEEYHFETLDIATQNGNISLDGLDIEEVDVETNSGNIDAANINTNILNIAGTEAGVKLNAVVAKDINLDVNKLELQVLSSITNNLNIISSEGSNMRIEKLVATAINVDAPEMIADLTLRTSFDYKINTPLEITSNQLEKNDNGYEYLDNEMDSIITYNFDNAEQINVDFISSKESKDE